MALPLRIYNRVNILLRRFTSFFYPGERRLPLLHCTFRKILERNFKENLPFYFLQIGAFDGIKFDYLYSFVKKRRSFGVVVEPIYEYYEDLVNNYSYNPNIIPVNVAVHSSQSEIILYKIKHEALSGLPDWASGITSVDPLHHTKLNIPSSAIIPVRVKALPVTDIMKFHYRNNSMHFLQIDVEGYDYEVLKSFDFSLIAPDMIKLEYINLSTEDVKAAIMLLRENQYYCLYDHDDLIGIRLSRVRL